MRRPPTGADGTTYYVDQAHGLLARARESGLTLPAAAARLPSD